MGLSSKMGHIQKIEDSLIWAKLMGLRPVTRVLSDEETVDLYLEVFLTGNAQNS